MTRRTKLRLLTPVRPLPAVQARELLQRHLSGTSWEDVVAKARDIESGRREEREGTALAETRRSA